MQVRVHDSISDIARSEWNSLIGAEYPFLRHEFLSAAENTGCVCPDTGWTPCHLSLENDGLRGALLLYRKNHSWGEFVFDWAWARAYEQAGLSYYPKLISAVPFTPASSPRILLRDRSDTKAAHALLDAAVDLASESGSSSLHVQFPSAADTGYLAERGLKLRKDCQFHWHNEGYADFDDFLARFSASKRKNARRDRRLVADAGITFRHLTGRELDARRWRIVYRLICRTFMLRGSVPYYNLEFFREVGRRLPDSIRVVLAERHGQSIAAAVFFESASVLYGRYWGSDGDYNALHFETCYYQGIEYCIEAGKKVFEPGTQGEHKISRGFVPVTTYSAHWLAHPQFFSAIGDYLDEEGRHIDKYMRAVEAHSPYRRDRPRT